MDSIFLAAVNPWVVGFYFACDRARAHLAATHTRHTYICHWSPNKHWGTACSEIPTGYIILIDICALLAGNKIPDWEIWQRTVCTCQMGLHFMLSSSCKYKFHLEVQLGGVGQCASQGRGEYGVSFGPFSSFSWSSPTWTKYGRRSTLHRTTTEW